jgi:hypothetical protein
MEKAIIKFNGGALALLCSECRVIIKEGYQFTAEEMSFAKGDIDHLDPQYCPRCSYPETEGTMAICNDIIAKREISDEEIDEGASDKWDGYKESNYFEAFKEGAKWYREQLKQRQ